MRSELVDERPQRTSFGADAEKGAQTGRPLYVSIWRNSRAYSERE